MAATPGLEVAIEWHEDADVSPRVQRKVNRLVRRLGAVLNEYEAGLYDMATLASNDFDFLEPCLTVNLPLHEDDCVFTMRMRRDEATRITLEDEDGAALAEVHLT